MRLLNNIIPMLNTYDINNTSITYSNTTAGILALFEDSKFDFDFWYCLFSDEKSFTIYTLSNIIDSKSLKRIKKKQAFLILDNTLEPFIDAIDSIYSNLVLKEGIPASQIILMTNMHDAKERSINVATSMNTDQIRIFWYTVFEHDLHTAAVYTTYRDKSNNDYKPNTLRMKNYSKKYLNFNRRWRLHRPFLTTLLHGKGLLDKGHVSLGMADDGVDWKNAWPGLLHYFKSDVKMLEILNLYSNVTSLPPLYLDTTDLQTNRAESTRDTNIYYEDTYFSVINETTYFQDEPFNGVRFLSEKAFKPIAMQHPFILVSVPNSLEIYKKMGYETFNGIINESYDLELDDGTRMLMIANEIDRLSNLSSRELKKFILTAREICKHNYEVLCNKKEFIMEL